MAVVIETLSRSGKIIEHKLFDADTITIGRGFRSDLRLEDPYVCAEHLVIRQDPLSGAMSFVDCQSVNGCKVNGQPLSAGELLPDDVIQIGRSRLRVFDASDEVAPTAVLSNFEENIGWINKLWVASVLTLMITIMVMLGNYLTTYQTFKIGAILPDFIAQLTLLFLWPLLLTLLGKLSRKESHFVGLLSITCLFVLALQVVTLLAKWLEFNLVSLPAVEWFSLATNTLLFAIFVWFSLFVAYHQPPRQRNRLTLTIAAVLLVPVLLIKVLNAGDFSAWPKYRMTMLPDAYDMVSPQATQDFIQQSDALFERVNDLSQQKNND